MIIVLGFVYLFSLDFDDGGIKATLGVAIHGGALIVLFRTYLTLGKSRLVLSIPISLIATFLFYIVEFSIILVWGHLYPGESIF